MYTSGDIHNSNLEIEDDNLDFRKIFVKLFSKWHWFLITIIFLCFIAFIYNFYKAPTYQINAKLLITSNDKSAGLGKQAGGLMDLGGLMGGSNSVENEVEILKTRFLMEQVVRQMQLNVVYYKTDGFLNRELNASPFKLEFVSAVDTIKPTKLAIKNLGSNKFQITSKYFNGNVTWNQKFSVKNLGVVKLTQESLGYNDHKSYLINVTSIDDRVTELMKLLGVKVSNKQVTVIDIGLSYALPDKGEEILSTLIKRYKQINLEDKNAIADSTAKFIKERLNVISSELGGQEEQVKAYKERNQLADMSEQGKLLVQNTGEFSSELAKAETQVSIINDLEAYLLDESKNKRVFPSALLSQDMVFSGLMNQYNSLLVERDKLSLSVTESSPFIQNIDMQILGLRRGILANIQSTKNSYLLNRNKLRQQLNSAEVQIKNVPEVEKNYLRLARNKDIKQELYIFLMQKAEETAISKTSNIAIAKTIDPAKSQLDPVSPKKAISYALALFLGLVIPIAIIVLKDIFNTVVSTKDDVKAFTKVPVLGEINHNSSSDNLIVANQGRSAISEQFRAMRTNLSFYLKSKNEKIILLTSSMSGEGKSFTAINLANVLALSGKRVLLMELDLRKPGLSAKLKINNSIGFSNFVINSDLKIEDLIKPLNVNDNMFIISSGPLPPNPAETLMSDRTASLIEELKDRFDYIIMDAPPIGIITDAQLLAPFADVTLYLVRQKVTQKEQLKIVDELHRSGKMKNLGIVVNDINTKEYGYGHGYGSYGEEDEKSWFKNILSKFGR